MLPSADTRCSDTSKAHNPSNQVPSGIDNMFDIVDFKPHFVHPMMICCPLQPRGSIMSVQCLVMFSEPEVDFHRDQLE